MRKSNDEPTKSKRCPKKWNAFIVVPSLCVLLHSCYFHVSLKTLLISEQHMLTFICYRLVEISEHTILSHLPGYKPLGPYTVGRNGTFETTDKTRFIVDPVENWVFDTLNTFQPQIWNIISWGHLIQNDTELLVLKWIFFFLLLFKLF